MRVMSLVTAVVTGVLLTVIPAPPGQAAAPALAVTVVAQDAASEAAAAADEARALRRDVRGLLQGYVDRYRDRFSPDEVATLLSYQRTADRQLASVVATTRRLEAATSEPGATTASRLAARRALAAWTRARSAAEDSWESARAIMEPRLSLLEKVGALRDYDAMMARFDRLGDRIRAATPRLS